MFVYVILLCFTLFVLVSANPLLQALAQQTCPVHKCQQDYRNLPVNRQQPRNTNPYIQPTTVQNTACPYVHSPQNEYEQMIFNKILANPTLKTLLDPNTKLLNQNGFEVQRQIPNNAGTVPNIINNYIIVPPELLLNEPMREEFRDDRRNHNRRRDETNQRNVGERKRKTNVNPKSEERQRPISQNARESKNGRQRQDQYRRDGYERDVSDDDYLEHDRQRHNPRAGQNDKRNREASLNRERQRHGSKDNADKIGKEVNERKKTQNSNSSDKAKSTMAYNEKATVNKHLSNEDIEKRVKDRSSDNHLVPKAQIKSPTSVQNKLAPTIRENLKISCKENTNNKQLDLRPQVNSYPRNPREEAVIQDFRRKFPAIPENVVRNLLSHLKQLIQNDQLGSNPYCLSCPTNYDQLYKTFSPNMEGSHDEGNRNRNGRRKSGRRRNRNRKQQKKENDCGCNTVIELAPSIYVEEALPTEPTTSKKEPIKTELEPTSTKREPIKPELESTTTKTQPVKTEVEPSTSTTIREPIKSELELTTTKRVPIKTELEPTTTKRIIERSTIKSSTVPAATESSTVKTEKDFVSTTTAKEIAETTTQSTIAEKLKYPKHQDDLYDQTAVPELGTEDVVPTIYINGIVDDYYPDFTADNHAYAYSNENLYVQNLQEDRYHYTTDKNIKMKELNRDRRKYKIEIKNLNQLEDRNIQSENVNGETDMKSFSAEIEATIPKPIDIDDISKEIQFRPPPFLDKPDFETKQINKGTLNTEEPYYYRKYEPTEKFIDVTDKASTYSDAKTLKYVIREKSEKKKPNTNIETVYAQSKVVKFGQTTERPDELISNETKEDLSVEDINSEENKLSFDSDTTFVIAKSYPNPW